jgi:hypothetical protein
MITSSTPELRSPEHADCLDFIKTLAETVPPLHPSAVGIIHEWLGEARCASHMGNAREVVRLMAMVREKITIELHWEAEVDEDIGDFVAAGALHAAADKWDMNARNLLYGPRRRRRRKRPPSTRPLKNFVRQPAPNHDYAKELPEAHRLAITAFINRKSQPGEAP